MTPLKSGGQVFFNGVTGASNGSLPIELGPETDRNGAFGCRDNGSKQKLLISRALFLCRFALTPVHTSCFASAATVT